MRDFRQYYRLESYLFDTVRPRFEKDGFLTAFDFFCIVVWKANRAKSKVAQQILSHQSDQTADLDIAVKELTSGIASQHNSETRLKYSMKSWGLRLPMASAILTVLYPDEFTVYDERVCNVLNAFRNLGSVVKFGSVWAGYLRYKAAVEQAAPSGLSLRDKDRYLWGRSFCEQLDQDIRRRFGL